MDSNLEVQVACHKLHFVCRQRLVLLFLHMHLREDQTNTRMRHKILIWLRFTSFVRVSFLLNSLTFKCKMPWNVRVYGNTELDLAGISQPWKVKLSLLPLPVFEVSLLHLSVGQLQAQVCSSLAVAQALADDVDCHVFPFREFGKGRIKKLRISPDAFIQISLQLAYYRVTL